MGKITGNRLSSIDDDDLRDEFEKLDKRARQDSKIHHKCEDPYHAGCKECEDREDD